MEVATATDRVAELEAEVARLEERLRWYERHLLEAADAGRIARERIAELERLTGS